MSYSFNVRGATRIEVMDKVFAEFDKIVAAQPIHSADRKQAQDAAFSFLGVVPDGKEDQDYYISVSGSLSWDGIDPQVIKAASVNVNASLIAKQS